MARKCRIQGIGDKTMVFTLGCQTQNSHKILWTYCPCLHFSFRLKSVTFHTHRCSGWLHSLEWASLLQFYYRSSLIRDCWLFTPVSADECLGGHSFRLLLAFPIAFKGTSAFKGTIVQPPWWNDKLLVVGTTPRDPEEAHLSSHFEKSQEMWKIHTAIILQITQQTTVI